MKAVFARLFLAVVASVFTMQAPVVQAAEFKEKVVWSFGPNYDGDGPEAGVIDVGDMLYGTTYLGGTGGEQTSCNGAYEGCGTIFAVDRKAGTEKVLYSFCSQRNCVDGSLPEAGLSDANGTLYGTTYLGGSGCKGSNPPGCGAVFAFNPSTGTEAVLYSFCSEQNCADGAYPVAGLISVKGMLYGTTPEGGGCDGGVVFALNPKTGAETVLHSFCGADGFEPAAGLIDVKGTFYGTTEIGGTHGLGTVFALDPDTGTETVLHSFGSDPDANDPAAGVIDVGGTLYGTTRNGGTIGAGAVFALDLNTNGETVLHSFCSEQNCVDGAYPQAGLISVNGALYGTTPEGGSGTNDVGTVFAIDPTNGAERVLYSFCSKQYCTDGEQPMANLIDVKGTLYGTTFDGGGHNWGTVFKLDRKH